MESPRFYTQVDTVLDVKYPEQFQGLKKIGDKLYAVSSAIVDVSVFFDPTKNFCENIRTICKKDPKRASLYKGQNSFQAAYASGMYASYDRRIEQGQSIPLICFDTIVDLDPDRRNCAERTHPVVFEQREIELIGSYSFDSFSRPKYQANSDLYEEIRLKTADEFIKDIKQIPDLLSLCHRNLCFQESNPDDFFNPSLGNMYAAAVSCIVKIASGNHCDDKKLPILEKEYVPYSDNIEDIFNYRKTTRKIVTRESNKKEKGCGGGVRIMAPLRDPIAAYDILQYKKIIDKKHPEGRNQAERAAHFLMDERENFTLNRYFFEPKRIRPKTSFTSCLV